ncbi:NUDIX domain-containing protein [Filobacillus milosensis]|uniref:NUDIX domain-containing protein n=1 Tax=Filobacillus milosensis TaxID=94137 RepID=A0A4Y8IGJ4_9BACI|nr:NUDIX domain-containing protein [Filobacillus milosensis]TFB14234.1 NUDIX domain-containing protein [Filobacillus milosensis]
MKTVNNFGLEFLDFIELSEIELDSFQDLAGSFNVIKCDGKYLLCYSVFRQQWEFPAGKQEKGETARDCAKRELYEESGQIVDNLEFRGVMKVFSRSKNSIKYNPVYYAEINQLQPFVENDETSEIMLWDQTERLESVDEVDIKLLEYI